MFMCSIVFCICVCNVEVGCACVCVVCVNSICVVSYVRVICKV